MIFIWISLALFPLIAIPRSAAVTDLVMGSDDLEPLTEQSLIDKVTEDCMIFAPATINLLGQVMVIASKVDVSFLRYSPNFKFEYIKYPDSFRATLLQVSNDGYKAFLGAHTAMNRIRLYMQQVPKHVKTMVKLLNSSASPQLIGRTLPQVIENVDRISKTCVQLAEGTESAFNNVMFLLGEVLAATKAVKGKYEGELSDLEIERNSSMVLHAEMKKVEAQRQRRYEEMKESVRKAREQYDQALKEIPTGFKALLLDAGRAFLSAAKCVAKMFVPFKIAIGPVGLSIGAANEGYGGRSGSRGYSMGQHFQNHGAGSSANVETINFASKFSTSLQTIIQKIPAGGNQTLIDPQLIQSLRVVCKFFQKTISQMPNNQAKQEVIPIIQEAVELVEQASNDPNTDLVGGLNNIIEKLQPFIAAAQMAPQNQAPIGEEKSGPSEGDNTQNEIFKARITQQRLSQVEQSMDAFYADHMAALERTAQLVAKLAKMDLEKLKLDDIIKMLHEAFIYLGKLKEQWHYLVEFFSNLSARIKAGFHEALQSFLVHARQPNNVEINDIDRTIILDFLTTDAGSVHKEAFILWVMSRTYYEVSQKYLMPRLAGLSLMLAARDDTARNSLLQQLGANTTAVQDQVRSLMNERRRQYMQLIATQKAKLTAKINKDVSNGHDLDVIEDAQNLLEDKSGDEN